MSKLLNKYSLGITLAVSVALLAFYQGDSTVEDVGEQIALKLLEILPRKHRHLQPQQPPSQQPENETETKTAAPPVQTNTPPQSASPSLTGPILSKVSSFDPVGHYNPKEAMERRYEGLRERCKHYSDFLRPELTTTTTEPVIGDLLVHPPSDLVFCPLNMVASKSVNTFFQRIRDPGHDYENKIKIFKATFPRSAKNMKRAILVRHPLERIVSAYRHTFERSYNAATNEEEGGELSFPDFVDIVLNGHEEYMDFLEENSLDGASVAIDTGMIDGMGTSKAWNPYWKQCGLCNPTFQPHYIMHLDHFQEDSSVLVELMGNPRNSKEFVRVVTEPKSGIREVEEHYFSQLTKSEIRELYEKYRMDHELFGFTPDYYIAMGVDDDEEEESGGGTTE